MWGLTQKSKLQDRYHFIGFISSGTYGRVYKAQAVDGREGLFAIKKFKPERENEALYTGISQSAIREMGLCAEISHPNVIRHIETILQDRSIYMVFEYCEHDLLQIIHHHSQLHSTHTSNSAAAAAQRQTHALLNPSSASNPNRLQHPSTSSVAAKGSICAPWALPPQTLRSIMYQLLLGTHHLHTNYVLHRDLKPANIMVSSSGLLSIGDLGLARVFRSPPHPLYTGDKVVVTIWYRAPELLLGARHYTTAVDMWAIGCIMAELLSLRPIFKGEEAKMEKKSVVPWQKSQVGKILDVLGTRGFEGGWDDLKIYPEYNNYLAMTQGAVGMKYRSIGAGGHGASSGLENWYNNITTNAQYHLSPSTSPGKAGFSLLSGLLTTNPTTRLSAQQALEHEYFKDLTEKQKQRCFDSIDSVVAGGGGTVKYPRRKITQEEDSKALPGTKRGGLPDDSLITGSRPATGLGVLGGAAGVSSGAGVGQAMTTGAGMRPAKRFKEG